MENVNIVESVGRGGQNNPDDVRKVQELLNEHMIVPLMLLVPNGVCATDTLLAIEEFQRRVVNLQRPDGKIDPQGMTMAALSPVALSRAPEGLVPYADGNGLYVTKSGDEGLFGTPKTLASIQNLARQVAEKLGAAVGITDISLEHGGKHPPHSSHRRGVDVDIRPLRKDNKNLPVTIDDAQYSHDGTEKMVGYLKEDPNMLFILFNDKKIQGVQWAKDHHHHLHVRFRE